MGNILLSDEGAGVRAVEELQKRYHFPKEVEVIDGGTMGIGLLDYFKQRSHVIIVDAAQSGNDPGKIIKIEDVPAFFRNKISPHQIGLCDVLAFAKITGDFPPHTILFGIEPEKLTPGLEMSQKVESKIDALIEKVVEELKTIGIKLEAQPV